MSDVALSMRRMSLTSVQLLSERVAPQPLTPHQGGRLEKKRRGTKEAGPRMISVGSEGCGRGRELLEVGGVEAERFVKDNRVEEKDVVENVR